MAVRYARTRDTDLPFYQPNLELPLIFESDFLCKENVRGLGRRTINAFNRLLSYYQKECELPLSDYQNILKLLTEVEDSSVQIKLKNARLVNRKIELEKNRFRDYRLSIKDPEEIPAEVSDGDYVILRKMSDVTNDVDKVHVLSITKINETYLEVRVNENFRKLLDTKCLYEVKFRKDRTVYRFEQFSIENVEGPVIHRALFPRECGEAASPNEKFEWLSNPVKTNPEQQQAVRNIVNGSSFPAPYILFGPPGTGKTTTLVEAIAQVCKRKPDANILVTASSNYACNEILSRLMDLDVIPAVEMFRYLSKSQIRKTDTIEDRILEISNIEKDHTFTYPTLETLQKYKLIFTTLVTSGRLVLKAMGKNHFDYIFVDEAGSATEASTIIPISGLVSYGGFKKRNHIILAGDPKQLGPIVLHRPAEKLMYGRSLLDRLMERKLYQPDDVTKKYNPACITKLLQNFRSHNKILAIPNKLFYDNELIAKAHPNITNVALGQRFLPNTKIPIIFHAVNGVTLQDADNPSLYNKEECEIVRQYVTKILRIKYQGNSVPEKEIGIISPYRRQCTELTKMLRLKLKLKDIEVGSVEQFQGQERCVIILSTVRSNTPTIGFLSNPKRLNVSITRAKALLIIVGNPKTLQLDKNWYELIKFCKENDVCTGAKFELRKSVRGTFKDKRYARTNGIHVVTESTKKMSVNDKITRESTKNNLSDWLNVDNTIQNYTKDNTSVCIANEKSSESPSTSTSNENISSGIESDIEIPPTGMYLDAADTDEIPIDNDVDDENEVNFRGTHFIASEDVFSTDENSDGDDDQSTKSDLCDTNTTTNTETNDNQVNGLSELDLNFDTFGFVQ